MSPRHPISALRRAFPAPAGTAAIRYHAREASEARPVIGIMCCNEFANRPVQAVSSRFLPPLARLSRASAMMIPAMVDCADATALSGRLDGLLLTGSRSNVAGHRYGQAGTSGHADEQRDEVALSLASRMIERGLPVFGICRGFQELNVLFGGSLRDLDDGHRRIAAPGESYESLFNHEHDILLAEGGVLAAASGARRLRVISAHAQGVARLGEGLAVEAVATDDGLVEAFSAEVDGAEVLAVQWHPEIAAETCPASRAFYQRIGDALRGATPRLTTTARRAA